MRKLSLSNDSSYSLNRDHGKALGNDAVWLLSGRRPEIPLGCHFRLAAQENAQIGLPELDLGAVPAWGGSARLTKCVGEHHALDMILRAKKISGPEDFRIGLVHEVWPIEQLKEKALELAQTLSDMPAQAVRSMLNVIVDGREKL